MEKFLFKTVELWVVLILVVLGLLFSVFMAWAVYEGISGKNRLGAAGNTIVKIAKFPETVEKVLSPTQSELFVSPYKVPENRFEGHSGFEFSYESGSRPNAPFLLLNRVDGNTNRALTEMVDLNTQSTVARTVWDVDASWAEADFQSNIKNVKRDSSSNRFRAIHSLILGDKLISRDHDTPIVASDACHTESVWANQFAYHHSMEKDADGNIWVPAIIEPKSVSFGIGKLHDDIAVQLSPEGAVKFKKSVIQILIDNDLGYFIYGQNDFIHNLDPIHLNDIEPVNKTTKYWRKGDVFLSIRHLSMVLLYRPSENKVLWYKHGPMTHQHDVDIISDKEISIFDNNTTNIDGKRSVDGVNQYMIYDFETDSFRQEYRLGFEENDIRTPTEGRSDQLPDGNLLVEETDFGRILALRPDGSVDWQYINRASDGNLYELGWSRVISREEGEAFLKAREGVKCE